MGVQVAELGAGRKLICDLTVPYDRSVYEGKEEALELRLVSRLLGPGDVFVDCGANIGLFTVYGADLVGATGKVLACEPVAETFMRLEENCALNDVSDRVRLFNNALAAESGIEVVLTGEVHNVMHVAPGRAPGGHAVRTVTIDEIVGDSPTVTGLKIDVEGYELEVLRGAEDTIARFSPWMLIEFNSELLGTRELRHWDVHAFLTERRYRAHLPRAVLAGNAPSLLDSWVSPREYVNLFYRRSPLSA
jgi:FkbM family methyltransferase